MTYNADASKTNYNKLLMNYTYAFLIKQYELHIGNHFFLESPALTTTKILLETNNITNNMYTCNHNDYDKLKYALNEQSYLNLILPENKMFTTEFLLQFKMKNGDKQFSSMWFDFCSSILGNDIFKPLDDIEFVLQNNMLTDISIVGFTFSKRCGNKDGRKKRTRNSVFLLKLKQTKTSNKSKNKNKNKKKHCDLTYFDHMRKFVKYLRNQFCEYSIKIETKYDYKSKKVLLTQDEKDLLGYNFDHMSDKCRANMYTFFLLIKKR